MRLDVIRDFDGCEGRGEEVESGPARQLVHNDPRRVCPNCCRRPRTGVRLQDCHYLHALEMHRMDEEMLKSH